MSERTEAQQDAKDTEDRRSALIAAAAYLIVPASLVILIVVAAIVGVTAWRVDTVARDTNRILRVEVEEKDRVIEAQQFVIDKQAVPAAIYLAQRLKAETGADIQLLFGPQHPPFTPAK